MGKFRLIIGMCCILMFGEVGFAQSRVGVVDIQAIVNGSSEVRLLKEEHNLQIESLNRIVVEAENEIAKENDAQKIVEIRDRYAKEFNDRKNYIDKDYANRLSVIEERLRKEIEESARRNNYDYVFGKSVVFAGGDDITDIVAKDVK